MSEKQLAVNVTLDDETLKSIVGGHYYLNCDDLGEGDNFARGWYEAAICLGRLLRLGIPPQVAFDAAAEVVDKQMELVETPDA